MDLLSSMIQRLKAAVSYILPTNTKRPDAFRRRVDGFVWGSAVLFAGTIAANALNYLFHLAIGRMVSAEVYGEIESLASLLVIVSVPSATLGMVATKYGARTRSENGPGDHVWLFRYLNRNILVYGSVLLGTVFLGTPWLRDFLNFDQSLPIFLVWALMFFSLLSSVTTGFLAGWQKFWIINYAAVWGNALKLIVGVGLVAVGFGVSGAMGGFLSGGIGGYLVSLLAFRSLVRPSGKVEHATERQEFSAVDPKEVRGYIAWAFFGNLAMAMLGNADMVFAKHHLEAVTAGEYGTLFIASKTIFFMTSVVASVLFAVSAGKRHGHKDSLRLFRQGILLTLGLCGGVLLVFSLFPHFVLGVLFHKATLPVAGALGWFALSASLYSLVNIVFQYLLSIRQLRIIPWLFAVAVLESVWLAASEPTFYEFIASVIVIQTLASLIGLFFVMKGFVVREPVRRA
jgi:O-antigen/teichoic acid export membrane protein